MRPRSTTAAALTPVSTTVEIERVRAIEAFLGLSNSVTTKSRSVGGKDTAQKVGEIVYMTPAGGNATLVGHFIAINNVEEAVVLAVRGTYSVSGVVADLEAQSSKSCHRAQNPLFATEELTTVAQPRSVAEWLIREWWSGPLPSGSTPSP